MRLIKSHRSYLIFLGLLLGTVGGLSLFLGVYQATISEILEVLWFHEAADPGLHFLIWSIRIPRVILAGCVGAGLAISGAAIQGLFRNPLADPSLIGINSGAMLFAALSMLFIGVCLPAISGVAYHALIAGGAFLGGLFTTYLVYRLSWQGGKTQVMTMLLAGIAVSAFAAALTGLCLYLSDDQQLRELTFWTLGSFNDANWGKLGVALPLLVGCIVCMFPLARPLNAILLGEREAAFLGVPVERIKIRVILLAALVVGICIASSGLIGFVGLVVPHFIRLWRGGDYAFLLGASALMGAAFMLGADTIARVVIAPAELPVGIITALLGAPFFLWLLLQKRKELLNT